MSTFSMCVCMNETTFVVPVWSLISKMEKHCDETTHARPMELFEKGHLVKMCAPMVRYSKLSFRNLVRKYGCDVAFTPMIMSDSFVKSKKARDNEFTTNSDDRALIVQFAAKDGKDFAEATELVYPYADGVDLNCGCPQRWAVQEGIGACLIRKPALLSDIVRQARTRISDPNFTVSIKIRVHHDIRKTVDMCQQIEKMGISWVAVHGRTIDQRKEPVNIEAIKTVADSVSIPVIANGDICSLDDALMVQEKTGVNGVMAARGLLANPAMFAGYKHTPLACVQDWVDMSLQLGTPFQYFHHHLTQMLDDIATKPDKRLFNCLSSTAAVLDFLQQHYNIETNTSLATR